MMTRVLTALGLVLLTGCATPTIPQELPADHPANPAALVAPPQDASTTLSLATADPLPRGAGAKPTGGEGSGEVSHADMQHGGDHAKHTPGTRPAAPQAGQPLFMCPMHQEVTSTNPNDRCPKCKMKINKPVRKQPPGAATRPAAAPSGSAAHEGHGGQHE